MAVEALGRPKTQNIIFELNFDTFKLYETPSHIIGIHLFTIKHQKTNKISVKGLSACQIETRHSHNI